MPGVLIVTHGRQALELVAAAEQVLDRPLPGFRAVALDWSAGLEDARARIREEVAALGPEVEELLVLTDLFGDTPSRAATDLGRELRIEVVTGVNLAMVLRLGCERASVRDLGELARWIAAKGRRDIRRLGPDPGPDGEAAAWGRRCEGEGEP